MRIALYGDSNDSGVCRQACGDADSCADQPYDVETVPGVADWKVKTKAGVLRWTAKLRLDIIEGDELYGVSRIEF